MIDYNRLRELANNATPGHWETTQELDGAYLGKQTAVRPVKEDKDGRKPRILSVKKTKTSNLLRAEANAAYIAALSPEVILELIEKAEIYDDLCNS